MKDPIKIALNFIKFRPRSVFEIEQKLKTKRISDKETKSTITVLKKNKLLDDKEFAKMWVRDRNTLRPSGSFLLKLELKKKGIADDIIEEILMAQTDEPLARKALESKSRYREADFQKKAAFLARRGFKTSVIYKILKN